MMKKKQSPKRVRRSINLPHSTGRAVYEWALRGVMSRRGVHSAADLTKLLKGVGFERVRTSIQRMIDDPKNISPALIEALCNALQCEPNDLFAITPLSQVELEVPRITPR